MDKLIFITIITAALFSMIFFKMDGGTFERKIPSPSKKAPKITLDKRVEKLESQISVILKILGNKVENEMKNKKKDNETKDKKNDEKKDKEKEKQKDTENEQHDESKKSNETEETMK
ncbi:hypothetical protein SLOPH_855 [Spraguea lophii 42_110]|uniref:Uncharacterized protein n=1 Tax=Spraguea lophii (strain 42_110) TaxID=1358809 RepID=S7WBQ7_SPRLO|nr:hypothetical protein SLOPH_855 [Spraguea lophii 42_110]